MVTFSNLHNCSGVSQTKIIPPNECPQRWSKILTPNDKPCRSPCFVFGVVQVSAIGTLTSSLFVWNQVTTVHFSFQIVWTFWPMWKCNQTELWDAWERGSHLIASWTLVQFVPVWMQVDDPAAQISNQISGKKQKNKKKRNKKTQ